MGEPMKILAVDDEQIVLDSIAKYLKNEDCELVCALSVGEAINALGQERIDIVLTDLMMPKIDGLSFMRDLQARQPGIAMIMITGYATITTAIQAKELGAFDYIAKPFSRQEFLDVVRRACEFVRESRSDR